MVTGATGFIGKHLCQRLHDEQVLTCALVRHAQKLPFSLQSYAKQISDFEIETIKSIDFSGIDCVIHLAAIAHQVVTGQDDELEVYRKANTNATVALAAAAAAAGVKRFIFLSSIGVNGISSLKPFTVEDIPAPAEPYAISKMEAEQKLLQLAKATNLDVVIIRPPLVYGPNAPGNFGKLLRIATKNIPLPLGAIHNKRSLVAIDNLVDLIFCCSWHPNAAGQVFLVSDDKDISTTALLRALIDAADAKTKLIPIPVKVLQATAALLFKKNVVARLSSDLQIDITHTKTILDWTPPVTFEQAIKRCFTKEDLC